MTLPVVGIDGPVVVLGRLVYIPPFEIPGITAADALDAGDAFGSLFSIAVPRAGVITKIIYHDLDNEGINKDIWLFRADIRTNQPASDAAFALVDMDNLMVLDVLTIDTFKTATNNQIGTPSLGLPCWYVAPDGNLYIQLKTPGVDNIAAGSMPRLSMTIERYADD